MYAQYNWNNPVPIKSGEKLVAVKVMKNGSTAAEVGYLLVEHDSTGWGDIVQHTISYIQKNGRMQPVTITSVSLLKHRSGTKTLTPATANGGAGPGKTKSQTLSLVGPGGAYPMVTIVGYYSDGSAVSVNPTDYVLTSGGLGYSAAGSTGVYDGNNLEYLDPLYTPDGPGYSGLKPYYSLIDSRIVNGIIFDLNDYPGKSLGYQWAWWEDDNWLQENFSFGYNDEQSGYEELNSEEKRLVALYPMDALAIKANRQKAEAETIGIFGFNGLNDKSDAFRHAFFNALNERDCGNDIYSLESIAKLFADAHEYNTPPQLHLESEMDNWNNQVGLHIGDVMFPVFTTNSSLSNDVFNRLTNGELRYLKPVEATPPPGSNGVNNDFWNINGNPQLGRHGITSATQLTPTNQ